MSRPTLVKCAKCGTSHLANHRDGFIAYAVCGTRTNNGYKQVGHKIVYKIDLNNE